MGGGTPSTGVTSRRRRVEVVRGSATTTRGRCTIGAADDTLLSLVLLLLTTLFLALSPCDRDTETTQNDCPRPQRHLQPPRDGSTTPPQGCSRAPTPLGPPLRGCRQRSPQKRALFLLLQQESVSKPQTQFLEAKRQKRSPNSGPVRVLACSGRPCY